MASHSPLFYMHSSAQFSLAAGLWILGYLLGVFLHHFAPKVSRTGGERGLVYTLLFLVVLGRDSIGFCSPLLAVFFLCFFSSTHDFPLFLPRCNHLLHSLSLHGFSHWCFSLTLFSSLTLKECTYSWLLGFFLGEVAAVVVFVGWFLGRGLDSFSFHGFGHLYSSLILPSSPTFQGDACSWVC